MAILYEPSKFLRGKVSRRKIQRLVNKRNVTLNKAALSLLNDLPFVSKERVSEVALKTINSYKKRFSGEDAATRRSVLASANLLVQRIENTILWETSKEIRKKYANKYAEWLPSSAEEPDPEHQLNYGKVFLMSEGLNGEWPNERYGCKCGLRILTDETELELD